MFAGDGIRIRRITAQPLDVVGRNCLWQFRPPRPRDTSRGEPPQSGGAGDGPEWGNPILVLTAAEPHDSLSIRFQKSPSFEGLFCLRMWGFEFGESGSSWLFVYFCGMKPHKYPRHIVDRSKRREKTLSMESRSPTMPVMFIKHVQITGHGRDCGAIPNPHSSRPKTAELRPLASSEARRAGGRDSRESSA